MHFTLPRHIAKSPRRIATIAISALLFVASLLLHSGTTATPLSGLFAQTKGDSVPESSFYTNFINRELLDQHGQPFDAADLLGKVTLFNFIFTHCSNTCPMQTAELNRVRELLTDDVSDNTQFVSVTVDPLSDTAEVLHDFATRMGVNQSHWSFVTGSLAAISAVADQLDLFGNGQESDPEYHITALWLVDPTGHLMMRYRGMPVDVKRISQEIESLYAIHQK